MRLSNGFILDLAINGVIIPLEHCASPEIQIDESDEFGIPIGAIMLVDNVGGEIIRQFSPVADGSLISITISSGDSTVTRELRSSGSQSEGQTLIIRGYLNHPAYITTRSDTAIDANSFEALKSIADTCGFDYVGVTTSDRMKWYPNNQRLINFARHILETAYVDDKSMLAGRITLDGSMRVFNLANADISSGIFGFGEGAIPIYGFRPSPDSLKNFHGGYKNSLTLPNIFGGSDNVEYIDVDTNESSLNTNPKMSKLAEKANKIYAPLMHPSNVHPNYNRALYNNRRLGELFTMKAKLIINNAFTNIDALNTITLSNANKSDGTANADLSTKYDGDWIISSKSIYVSNGQYFELYNLMRMGLDSNMHAITI